MSTEFSRRRSLESFKKEAKRWLAALRSHDADARARLALALPSVPPTPTLRDVQLALAREQGFPGWADLKEALERDSDASTATLERYEDAAAALLDAYRTGTPEAMERHYRLTWHRRVWPAMRTYVQLDLGKRPATPDGDVPITIDDARYLVAREHGFDDWMALRGFVAAGAGPTVRTAKPMHVRAVGAPKRARPLASSHDWPATLELLKTTPRAEFDASGEMTDRMLKELTAVEHLESLNLSASRAVTENGFQYLSRFSNLRRLDLSATDITDRALAVLRDLPKLETLSLIMTGVTDAGATHLAHCHELRELLLNWTNTGDGAIRALAGKPHLHNLRSGNGVTDAGIALLHELPVFKTWQGQEPPVALFSYDASVNYLLLRGPFTNAGLQQLRGLDGLFALNLDAGELGISAEGMRPLVSLPHLGWLSVDAKDDWMPLIAQMPRLRFLGAQDTTAGDAGFIALSRSQSLEYIWGRRCHGLQRDGFLALAEMPALRGLSVSCLNVDEQGIAALPRFPSLKELMPMDIPDARYEHIGQCTGLESLILMYCRDTTDGATEHITGLRNLKYYFNSYTTITDRTPELLSGMDSLERITFDGCHNLTDAGVARLARLPKLRELSVSGRGVSAEVAKAFPATVAVSEA